MGDGRKRRAGGNQRLAIGPADQILRGGLRLVGRIGQRKNDRAGRLAGHFTDDGFGEGTAHRGQTDQNHGVDAGDDIRKPDLTVGGARPGREALLRLRASRSGKPSSFIASRKPSATPMPAVPDPNTTIC